MKTGGEVEEEARLQPQGRHNTNSCLGSWDSRQRLGKIWLRYGATFFGRDLTEGFIIQHVNRTAMTDIIQFPWITCLYEIILALTGLVTVVVLHLKKMGHLATVVKHSEEMIWWTQGWCSENNLFIFHRMFLFVEIIHNTQNAAFITELYQSTPIWTTPNWNTFKWTAFSILNLRSTNQLNIVGLDAFLKSGSSNCIHTILYGLFRLSICNCGKDYSLDRKALLLRVNVEVK